MNLSALNWMDWVALLTGWCLLAVAVGPWLGRSMRDKPASKPTDDRTWLDDQPRELVGAELDGQFYGIVAREWYL